MIDPRRKSQQDRGLKSLRAPFMPHAKPDPQRLIQLLLAVAGGDEKAFEELYALSSANLYGLLLRILRRPDWAEEALQDCFLRIWHRSDSYAPEKGAPLAWLMSIARYRALDLLRSRRPEVDLDEVAELAPLALVSPEQGPEARMMESEALGRLARCMQELRDEERQCLLLAYYEGYTHPELVQAMGVPLGTVKSWVRRGLARMRRCLQGLSSP